MSTAEIETSAALVLRIGPPWRRLTSDEFLDLCHRNPELRLERIADGDLLVMTPTGGDSGRMNMDLGTDVNIWNRVSQAGYVFDSSTLFELPNGAIRSPDCSWVDKARWEALPAGQRRRVPPIAPDFVAELRSPSDSLTELRAKMREYLEQGVRLGWLIDPDPRRVWVYRAGEEQPVVLENPKEVHGDPVLPGFKLEMARIWGEG